MEGESKTLSFVHLRTIRTAIMLKASLCVVRKKGFFLPFRTDG